MSYVGDASPGSAQRRDACTAARLLALILSLLWGVPGFALIDLDTALPPGDPQFREHWFLESGWGLFITALVLIPLLAVSLAPALVRDVAHQLHIMAGCAVAAGALCLEVSMAGLAAGFVITAWVVWSPLRDEVQSYEDGGQATRRRWALAVTAVYAGLPMFFGLEAYTVKVAIVLLGVLGPVLWLAFASRVVIPGHTQTSSLLVARRVFAHLVWPVAGLRGGHRPGVPGGPAIHRYGRASLGARCLRTHPGGASTRGGRWLAADPAASGDRVCCRCGVRRLRRPLPRAPAKPGQRLGLAAIFASVVMLAATEIVLWRRGSREYVVRTPLLDPP